MATCPQCGASVDVTATECKYCGERITPQANQQVNQQYAAQPQAAPQPIYVQQFVSGTAPGIDPTWPIKNKIVAGLLGIFLGAIGIHKFYMGKVGMGVLYLLLSWTFVPAIIGFIEGVIYLCSNDYNFQVKNRVRIG